MLKDYAYGDCSGFEIGYILDQCCMFSCDNGLCKLVNKSSQFVVKKNTRLFQLTYDALDDTANHKNILFNLHFQK